MGCGVVDVGLGAGGGGGAAACMRGPARPGRGAAAARGPAGRRRAGCLGEGVRGRLPRRVFFLLCRCTPRRAWAPSMTGGSALPSLQTARFMRPAALLPSVPPLPPPCDAHSRAIAPLRAPPPLPPAPPALPPGLKIEVPTWCGRWVVGMDDYKVGRAPGGSGARSGYCVWEGGGGGIPVPLRAPCLHLPVVTACLDSSAEEPLAGTCTPTRSCAAVHCPAPLSVANRPP